MNKNAAGLYNGFSKLKRKERIDKLVCAGIITAKDAQHLSSRKNLSFSLAEKLIENLIGYYHLPLGIAVNFNIDQRDYVIPMVVEETSVIAAASKTAKWIREHGEIVTESLGNLSIGQIQLSKINNFPHFEQVINKNKKSLIAIANNHISSSMIKRGGGVKDLQIRNIPRGDGNNMGVIHLLIETCDAMGANFINQLCEYLKRPIEQLTSEKVNLCILSNLTDHKLVRATVTLENIPLNLGSAIEEASLFTQQDPYRAATNNKGVLNGMDSVVIATGNDWRAIEAGVHAYAAHQGQYRSITRWYMQNKKLIGVLEAPVNVGIVGGVTRLHPTAHLCLKMLGVNKASELSRIIAAVGLVQNLGALRALTTDGIVKGHMKLHITNLCLAAGAKTHEIKTLKKSLEKLLTANKRVSVSDATQVLNTIRQSSARR